MFYKFKNDKAFIELEEFHFFKNENSDYEYNEIDDKTNQILFKFIVEKSGNIYVILYRIGFLQGLLQVLIDKLVDANLIEKVGGE